MKPKAYVADWKKKEITEIQDFLNLSVRYSGASNQ